MALFIGENGEGLASISVTPYRSGSVTAQSKQPAEYKDMMPPFLGVPGSLPQFEVPFAGRLEALLRQFRCNVERLMSDSSQAPPPEW